MKISSHNNLYIGNYLYYSLSFLWVYSGVISLINYPVSFELLSPLNLTDTMNWLLLITASVLDIVLGLLFFTRLKYTAYFYQLQLMTVIIYNIIMLTMLPSELLHPFASIPKNIVIISLLVFLYQYHQPSQS
ncbi:MAG: DoxX-like family protein [Moraxella sp.]|nr:DoxX-like family protein [Moraxella sp.]